MKYITQDIEAVQTIIKNDIPRIAVEVVRDILQGHGYELITDEAKYLYIFNNEGLIKAEDIVITDENRSILDDEYFEVISCCNTENSKDIVKLLSFATDLLENYVTDMQKSEEINFADVRSILLANIHWDVLQQYITKLNYPETTAEAVYQEDVSSDERIKIDCGGRMTTVYPHGYPTQSDWIEKHQESIDKNNVIVSIEAADVHKGQGYNVNVFVNFANDNTTYLFINEVSSSEKIYSEYLQTFLDNYTGQINYIKNEGENSQEVTR